MCVRKKFKVNVMYDINYEVGGGGYTSHPYHNYKRGGEHIHTSLSKIPDQI